MDEFKCGENFKIKRIILVDENDPDRLILFYDKDRDGDYGEFMNRVNSNTEQIHGDKSVTITLKTEAQ